MNNRYFRLFLRIMAVIIPAIIGVFLGFKAGLLYTNAYSQGRFEPWRKIAQPPGKIIKFLAAGENQLYVNTSGGIFFAPNVDAIIGHVSKQSWVKVDEVSHPPTCYLFYNDYQIPEPPEGIIDSIQTCYDRPEMHTEYHYALLDNGQIWVWKFGTYGWGPVVPMLAISISGLILGLAVAIWLWKLTGRYIK